MGKKLTSFICLYYIAILYSLSLISAPAPQVQFSEFPTGLEIAYPQFQFVSLNSDFNLSIHVYNSSQYITGSIADCYLDIYNFTGSAIAKQKLEEVGEEFITPLTNNFTVKGMYSFIIECNTTEQSGFANGIFDANTLGREFTTSQAVIYGFFLTLLVFIFILNFVVMSYLPSKNERDEEGKIMTISYLKYLRNVFMMTGYFLFIAILYITSNLSYAILDEELVADTLFVIYRLAFMFAPVIVVVWLVWIFASMFHDRQFQNMLNRGMMPGSV